MTMVHSVAICQSVMVMECISTIGMDGKMFIKRGMLSAHHHFISNSMSTTIDRYQRVHTLVERTMIRLTDDKIFRLPLELIRGYTNMVVISRHITRT